MSYKQFSPIPVEEGGTNATSFANNHGVAVYEGGRLITLPTGVAGNVLTSNGILLPPSFQAAGSAGIQTLDGNTGSASGSTVTISGSGGIVATGSGSTISLSVNGLGLNWTNIAVGPITMAPNNGYIMSSGSLITATLPATAAIGTIIAVEGNGSGLFTIAQNAGQIIHFGAVDTTSGASGSLSSNGSYDSVELLCVVADTEFKVRSSMGSLSYV